jgi:hypothetical protein
MTPSKFQSMMARVQTNAYANREADKLKSEAIHLFSLLRQSVLQ